MTTATYRNFSGTAAEAYQQYFVPAIGTPAATGLLRRAAVRPGEQVLDVACGTGVVARLAAEAAGPSGAVTGVDLAADMIAVAETIERPGDAAPIEWRQADAESLPFPDASFDVVLCQMGLMFMQDKVAALAEMHRVLQPGGRIVVNTPGRIQPPLEAIAQGLAEHINPDLAGFVRVVFSMHDPDAVGALLAAAGFEDVQAAGETAQLDLPGPADFLWQYIALTPMAPLVAGAPDEAKAALEADVVAAWDSWVVDGRTPVEQPMVVAEARRS